MIWIQSWLEAVGQLLFRLRFRRSVATLMTLGGVVALLLVGSPSAVAQPIPDGAIVTTNAPLPLLVNGLEAQSVPVTMSRGSEACVPTETHYVSVSERWIFAGWSNGSHNVCVMITDSAVYRAVYAREVIVTISSQLPQFRRADWVSAGTVIDVEVPREVSAGDRTRYRFAGWSNGETGFSAKNRIAILSPTTLDVRWLSEYLVTAEGPAGVSVSGSGWYQNGSVANVRAPAIVETSNPGERLVFSSWENSDPGSASVGAAPTAQFAVNGPVSVKAQYKREFFVTASNPAGSLQRNWFESGSEIPLETPAIMEVVPSRERLVFVRWDGIEGLTAPKITGVINSPVDLRAIYQRQFKLTLSAPFGGGGDGWYDVGATALVSVPEVVQSKLVFQSRFAQFAGQGIRPTVQWVVQGPVTIEPIYVSSVNFPVLVLFAGFGLGVVTLIFGARWLAVLLKREFRY